MVVPPLRPGKFYGSSLPRPRFYTDIKFSDERVDPPLSVLDPLMSWAQEAHWSMGGLSLHRPRLQGRIEGNVQKLRKEREKSLKKKIQNATPISQSKTNGENRGDSTPPAPMVSKKRRGQGKWVDEDDEVEEEEIEMEAREDGGMKKKRRLVRKLGVDFEMVASENRKSGRSPSKDLSNGGIPEGEGGVALRTRSRRTMVLMEEEEDDNGGKTTKKDRAKSSKAEGIKESNQSVSPNGPRSSPRLKKREI